MNNHKKGLWSILGLIVVVSAVLVYVAADNSVMAQLINTKPKPEGPVSVKATLVQDKVLSGSDGKVGVSLTLAAAEIEQLDTQPLQHADLVIVLDRSGSMQGQKISDARQAVIRLIDRLTARDRLAFVTYSNSVNTIFSLVPMDESHRRQVKAAVRRIYSGGGTNLGGGLQRGIQTLMQTQTDGRQRKVILISDGLANHGITDHRALGSMASGAVEHNFSVSTVGVGYDFNEMLMTTIADHGAGSYYFLENPNAFAQVFEKEFQSTRNVAASALEIRVPLKNGVKLIHAGGYPIKNRDGFAVIHPGDLLSGQQRKLFLTFKVPTDRERRFNLSGYHIQYTCNGVSRELTTQEDLSLACVADKKAVMASIDQEVWGEQVVKEDYNRLKEEVADAIRKGRKDQALQEIKEYEAHNRAVNATVGSAKVTENLEKDVQGLRQSVEDTFSGAPAAVAEKKKQRSKALQYESYQIRRAKK
ncbi:MAG: VWA domain-containing protein [Desulfobacteraceae bacterium]|jgi:Ca-activated chloride channel family protein